MERSLAQPVGVGIVAALVGFTSSFAVVVTGLRAVGATPAQAASGLLVLCVVQGLGMIWLSRRHRAPLTLAWSTPGAAVLAGAGGVAGGWPAAVGAFVVCGALIGLTAAWPALGRLVAAIPVPVAQAMLAGVLLSLCLEPLVAVTTAPLLVGPVIVVWLVLARLAPRWATPVAFGLAVVLVLAAAAAGDTTLGLRPPGLVLTTPELTLPAVVGIALPLYVVTMASQNVPGVSVLASFGYAVPWRETLLVTGAGTMVGAFAGGHAVNLAAITAALPASAEAHPDPPRRWVATQSAGWAYLVLAVLSPLVTALVAASPAGVFETVAGLALLTTLGSALAAALRDESHRVAATATFLTAASPLVVLGVGSAFWALVVGLVVWALLVARPPRRARRRAVGDRAAGGRQWGPWRTTR
ncbi:benzoate/H(+) symporter BenE family transporter [Isoptericola sp. NPDC060257]|uniref:benzoate/H(+) symporter BenE family transporter n=1 Tax=Isoptericola sp. NPDC060257 TaxID=3347087 RepID=UPI00366A40F7